MFRQFHNIESSFRYIRWFSFFFLLANIAVCAIVSYKSLDTVTASQQKVFVVANGKLLEAVSSERKNQLPVEVKDHVKNFHNLFFNLEPDEIFIRSQLAKAMYLADGSARNQYRELSEAGYYSGIVSGNISQRLQTDSVQVDLNHSPWHVRYYGKLSIIRSTSVTTRLLITEGDVRDLGAVTDNNPHGFLLEKWKIIDNREMGVMPR